MSNLINLTLHPKKEENQNIRIIKTKPDIKSKNKDRQDIKMIKTRPDMNEITYKEEKAALILGITDIFTVWWMFKCFISFSFSP